MKYIDADLLLDDIYTDLPKAEMSGEISGKEDMRLWMLSKIENAPTVNPWHRVEDELPKFGEYVLAWEIQGFAVVDKYVGIGDGRWDLENAGAIYTHWMPLPEPPKEGER